MKRALVTGGAGFIGSAVCRYLVGEKSICVLNVDKLTYAGNSESLREIDDNSLYSFEQVDICDRAALLSINAVIFTPLATNTAFAGTTRRLALSGPRASGCYPAKTRRCRCLRRPWSMRYLVVPKGGGCRPVASGRYHSLRKEI